MMLTKSLPDPTIGAQAFLFATPSRVARPGRSQARLRRWMTATLVSIWTILPSMPAIGALVSWLIGLR